MRIFVGIVLSSLVIEQIVAWQNRYKEHFAGDGIRWIDEENLHITIVPPWGEKHIDEVKQKLQQIKFSPSRFSLLFQKIHFFPKSNSRYLWLEGETPNVLLKLREQIADLLQRSLEKRSFKTHVTLARLKGEKFNIQNENVDWRMEVKTVMLFQSHISPKGAAYKDLLSISLV